MNPVFEKWRSRESKDKSFTKQLFSSKFSKKHKNINSAFSKNFVFVNHKIIAPVGVGTAVLNEYTATAIAQSFARVIRENCAEKKEILLINDRTFHGELFTNIFARVIDDYGFKVVMTESSDTLPETFHRVVAQENDIVASVYIGKHDSSKNNMQISFYCNNGQPFCVDRAFNMQENLAETDYMYVEIPDRTIKFKKINYSHKIIDKITNFYTDSSSLKDIEELRQNIQIGSRSNIEFFEKIFKNLNLNIPIANQYKNKNWFKSKLKHLNKIHNSTIFRKNDVNIAINSKGSGLVVSYKHKHVYKYLNTSQLAGLYLYFLINDDPNFDRTKLSKYYVARSIDTGSLVDVIASKNNLDVFTYSNDDELFDKFKQNKNLLLAHNNEFEYIINPEILTYNAYSFALEILRMVAFYKQKNLTLFDILSRIYDEFGFSHTVDKIYDLEHSNLEPFINRIKMTGKLANQKITSINEYKISNNSLKTQYEIRFAQGERCVLSYNGITEKLNLFSDVRMRSNDKRKLDAIIREKEIIDNILDLKETNRIKTIKLGSIIKYIGLVLILVGIFLFLFHSVYNYKDSTKIGDANIGAILWTMWNQINHDRWTRLSFIAMLGWFPLYSIINSIIFKRLLTWQNVKVKFSDLMIGSLISLVAQNVTPKSIGGDLATYWFLRRRDVPRPELLSSIVINTFIWQISNLILTIIFVPIGIHFYGNFFANLSDPAVLTMLISLILGITIDTFLVIIVLVLSLSSKLQNKILKTFVHVVEWLPFIHVYDSEAMISKYQYELYKVREGLKTVLRKWYNFVEILFWKIILTFYVPTAWFALSADMLQPDLVGGSYFNMTVASVLARNINSISPTPGGTGTSDIINKAVYEYILKPDVTNGWSATQRSSLLTSIKGMGEVILPTFLSAIILFIVFIGEKRVDHYRDKAKNETLNQTSSVEEIKKIKSKFYPVTFSLLTLILLGGSILFIFNPWV
ncbi:phosphoglucomutase/phosphomannomutase [Mycoplasmopsis californica HAZ160_1]|uniref:Phosphoglucomutase/phosphomannomutase n=1 Tax=Mycoplasmopsis californica HAZ160_1 TaxID=1397850 RepID=A0AAT9F7H2_9BACT|nr:lysylphosphatidylglycerol synthase transmembrane domain-containing protein [Mycoplasmopsis californica]BAP00855.1 phosphoglucomutase/phosphomannomutase [Mycoplasmopsis californica HAZ160_1]BBG40711.1 phosphoglucomutase/phosphomannomutase [Mycoplasmopsis californica]BBG41305.1 phosphoglucomutase/phosphomannomutase [Mycoplasmopsis californica]BBG41898.1 phosphoglucomutase/phosphomannomutase [Mycoplasmopsis californica]BBG42491.1 phosphoglucomutase/phosphomannomutase [Mycoplasmopsis californic